MLRKISEKLKKGANGVEIYEYIRKLVSQSNEPELNLIIKTSLVFLSTFIGLAQMTGEQKLANQIMDDILNMPSFKIRSQQENKKADTQ